MSINFFPSGIESRETNPRLREPNDVAPQVQQELMKLGSAFAAEQAAALALLNKQRGPAADNDVFSGPAHIAGATNSKGAMAILADLFAPARDTGRTIG